MVGSVASEPAGGWQAAARIMPASTERRGCCPHHIKAASGTNTPSTTFWVSSAAVNAGDSAASWPTAADEWCRGGGAAAAPAATTATRFLDAWKAVLRLAGGRQGTGAARRDAILLPARAGLPKRSGFGPQIV